MTEVLRHVRRVAARVMSARAEDPLRKARVELREQIESGRGTLGEILTAALLGNAPGELEWARRIEAHRLQLLTLDHIEIDRPGGPRPVSAVCASDSKRPGLGRLLYRLAHLTRADRALELGTCLGISGSYIAAGLRDHGGRLNTLEGNPRLVQLSTLGFSLLGLCNVRAVQGDFSAIYQPALADGPVDLLYIDGNHREDPTVQYFEEALEHLTPDAVVVFDDITWSDAMVRAWDRIRAHPATNEAYSLAGMGFVAPSASSGPNSGDRRS